MGPAFGPTLQRIMAPLIDLIYFSLSVVLVLVVRYKGHYGANEFKDQAHIALAGAGAAWFLLSGSFPSLGNPAAVAFGAFVLMMAVSCFWSDYPRNSMEDLPRWAALLFLFLICQRLPLETVLLTLYIPAIPAAIYGLIQQFFKVDPIWKPMDEQIKVRAKATRMYSWLGNSNYTGAYLVPMWFIGLHLIATHTYLWLIPQSVLLVALVWSQCRAAWAAAIAGSGFAILFVQPRLFPIAIIFAVIVGMISMQRIEATMGRVFYTKICWEIFRKKPIFGWGLRVFRRKIFRIQAQQNQRDPSLLGTGKGDGRNEFPVGQRAHNDIFEIAIEIGLVGLSIFALFSYNVIMSATALSLFLAAGIVAGLVNAFFFYNLRMTASALPFFGLAGAVTPSIQFFNVTLLYGIPLAAIVAYMVYLYAYKPFMAGWLFEKANVYQWKKDFKGAKKYIEKALRYDEYNNFLLSNMSAFMLPIDPAVSMSYASKLIHHFDGQKLEWAMWEQYGTVCFFNKAFLAARGALMMSLYLKPGYPPAVKGLQETNKVLAHVEEELKKQAIKDQEKKAA